MSKINNQVQESGVEGEGWLKRRLLPLLTLVLVIASTVGIYLIFGRHPERLVELENYAYWGAFLISLIFNATVILPAGNILVIAALGAILPSAVMVGVAGGAVGRDDV